MQENTPSHEFSNGLGLNTRIRHERLTVKQRGKPPSYQSHVFISRYVSTKQVALFLPSAASLKITPRLSVQRMDSSRND